MSAIVVTLYKTETAADEVRVVGSRSEAFALLRTRHGEAYAFADGIGTHVAHTSFGPPRENGDLRIIDLDGREMQS